MNKDVPITEKAQITLPDIQLKTAFSVFRLYVKNITGQPHYRIEDSLQVNQSLKCLKSILNPYEDLEKKIEILSTKVDSLMKQSNNG